MSRDADDPYLTMGLPRDCTLAQVRAAYRRLAKQWHPDRNGNSPEATARSQKLNAAYATLGDPVRRAEYDLAHPGAAAAPPQASSLGRNGGDLARDAHLRVEDFMRGTHLTVQVNDPANPDGPETYAVEVPPETAPGTRFRLPRTGAAAGGRLVVRLRLAPGRFRAKGSDLRCDLRITAARAAGGGTERVPGPGGGLVRVDIPPGVARNAVLRVPGEGLPKPRGGRGDLLVRVTYRPEVRVSRGAAPRSGLRRLR